MASENTAVFIDRNYFKSATTLFKVVGLWRTDRQSKWLEPIVFLNRLNVFFTFGWAFTASVLSGCYIYYMEGETERAFVWGTFSVTYVFIQYKFWMLSTKESKIRNIIAKLEKYSKKYSDKSEVKKSLLLSERLLITGSLLIGSACIGFCITPVILNYRKVLPIKTMFTFGANIFESPIYELYIIYQVIGTMSHTVIAMVFDMTYVGFLLVSAAILKNINKDMKRHLILMDYSSTEKQKILVQFIEDHVEMFEFLNEIRSLFMGSNMLHFSYNYITAGLTMFQVSRHPVGSGKFFSMISGCSSCVFTLVSYCESGQKISDEMNSFWQNLYELDWYNQPMELRKTIAFALLSTQTDYYMAAGKLMTLSRETEKKIMQAIFTYYTFLLRLNS